MDSTSPISLRQYKTHSRNWRENLYVYPVISRRSGGLSLGVNLNPDAACNFDCIYCQVDRTVEPRVREVEVARLGDELTALIEDAQNELSRIQGADRNTLRSAKLAGNALGIFTDLE